MSRFVVAQAGDTVKRFMYRSVVGQAGDTQKRFMYRFVVGQSAYTDNVLCIASLSDKREIHRMDLSLSHFN